MIVLFTDFGLEGPYIGQMQAVLHRKAPNVPVVNLFADVPPFDPQGAAYLLSAYTGEFPPGTVFLCVIDPGVGTNRRAALVGADRRWYVGPDNGLFNIVAARARDLRWWDVTWRPARLSASFHGRDLFAPVAAALALGEMPPAEEQNPALRLRTGWPDDLGRLIYVDGFGNAMTGIRAASLPASASLDIRSHRFPRARTFSDVPAGAAFWYENANGLAEVAVNQGCANEELGLRVGDPVVVVS
ncbi:MAG: SAM-dependent chlorinase/fluorinase [Gammaproteobacteria bacterium]